MSLDAGRTPGRGGSGQDLWPKWMWVAVPVLVVVVVAGLWWAIFSPGGQGTGKKATPTPLVNPRRTSVATQAPTTASTLAVSGTMTTTPQIILPPTNTPAPAPTSTIAPTVPPAPGLSIGAKAKVINTGGQGLNMRSAAGTGHARVKTLRDGAVVEIIGGPTDADNYTWWQVRDEAGVTGWVVGTYLSPQ